MDVCVFLSACKPNWIVHLFIQVPHNCCCIRKVLLWFSLTTWAYFLSRWFDMMESLISSPNRYGNRSTNLQSITCTLKMATINFPWALNINKLFGCSQWYGKQSRYTHPHTRWNRYNIMSRFISCFWRLIIKMAISVTIHGNAIVERKLFRLFNAVYVCHSALITC